MRLIIVYIPDDKFNKWFKSDTAKGIIYLFYESTEFLEKIFKKPIVEIRSVEGNYLYYLDRRKDQSNTISKKARTLVGYINDRRV